jgi:hypothetical protein
VKINDMKEYRDKQIQEITKLWKEIVRVDSSNNKPNKIVLNSINTKTSGKYYGFLVRKTKIPPKSMQRVQISQTIEPINGKNEIWIALPIEDIPKNLTCEEQIINYKKGEGYIWITNPHENDVINLKKGTCLVEIQVVSEVDVNNWKKSGENLVNNINTQENEYPLSKTQFF